MIRTDDPDLTVTAVGVNDLADFCGPEQITLPGERGADQNGVPPGHEHRLFSLPIDPTDTQKFLRLRVELGP